MTDIAAHLVINFTSGGGSGVLKAEIDSRPTGHNGGNTQFTAGQPAYYLVSKTDNVIIEVHEATSGYVTYVGSEVETKTELLIFAQANSATTQYPISGSYETKWLGTPPGHDLALASPDTFELQENGSPVEGLGVLYVEYETTFLVYKLEGLQPELNGETAYEVLVYMAGASI